MNAGDAASAQCTITKGDSPIEIQWFHNGQPVTTTSTEQGGLTVVQLSKRLSVLSIDYVRDSNAGNYTCKAANRAGTVEFTSLLTVNGIFISFLFFLFLLFIIFCTSFFFSLYLFL